MERPMENIGIGKEYPENCNGGNMSVRLTTNEAEDSIDGVEVLRSSSKIQTSNPKKIMGDNSVTLLKTTMKQHKLRAQDSSCARKETERQKSQMNALYHFFMSMYETTKKMPPTSQYQVRNRVFQVVSNVEADILNISNTSQYTHCSNENLHLPYSTSPFLQTESNSSNRLLHSSSSATNVSHPHSSNNHSLVSRPIVSSLSHSNSDSAGMASSPQAAINNVIKEEIMEESLTMLNAENQLSHNSSPLQQLKLEEVYIEENPHLNLEEVDALHNLNQSLKMEAYQLDYKVKDILTKANLSQNYEAQFKDARIDMGIIPFLGQEVIKQLINPLGDQIRFKHYLKSFVQDEGIRESPFYSNQYESPDTSILDSCSNSKRKSTDIPEEVPKKLVRVTPAQYDLYSPLSFQKEMEVLDIREIIANHSILSKSLLQKFSGSGGMREYEQGTIVKILVDYAINAFNVDLACHRSNQVFHALSEKIISLFPKEVKSTFFIPPVFNDMGLQTVRARGKLIERYYYVLRRNKEMAVSPNIRKRNICFAENCQKKGKKMKKYFAEELNLESDRCGLEAYIANREMLLSHNESWDVILKTWEKTSLRRLREVYNLDQPQEAKDSPLTVSTLTELWPIIKDPRAYSLLEIDFLKLYKMESSPFIKKWSMLKAQLKSILSTDVKDKAFLQYLQTLSDDSCEGEDGILLAGIPYLFSPKNTKSHNGSVWRPSTAEAQEGFFSIALNSCDVLLKIANRRSRLSTRGVSIQPFVVAQGTSLFEIKKCVVCIEDFLYEFSTPVEAINSCMMCIHALGAEYDLEARRSWLFLQKCFFGIDTLYDDGNGVKEPRVDSLCYRMTNQDYNEF